MDYPLVVCPEPVAKTVENPVEGTLRVHGLRKHFVPYLGSELDDVLVVISHISEVCGGYHAGWDKIWSEVLMIVDNRGSPELVSCFRLAADLLDGPRERRWI